MSELAVAEAVGIKNIIGAHSNGCLLEGTALAIGLPLFPSYIPGSQLVWNSFSYSEILLLASLGVSDDSSTFSTRVTNVLFAFLSWYQQRVLCAAAEKVMIQKLGPQITPVWETMSNMTWVLSNSEPLLDFPKPTLNKIVEIGGIGVSEAQPLNREWSDVLDLRPATILISFGTVAPSVYMPDGMKGSIINVITSYPNVTFIWKYEQPDDPLFAADDRLSLFTTHGGSGSMLEAATYGKPLILVPLFGDQTRNAKLVIKYGFGILLEKALLMESNVLREAIHKIFDEKRYRNAALRMRRMLSQRVMNPKEKLVRTIQLAAEFGTIPEQLVAGRNLSFVVYYNIDLILLALLLLAISVFVISYFILYIYRYFMSDFKAKLQ
ncbi:unnamed protein product [Strongylus vulgaris]|uniref:glucuronosyltransferase n=1 Tax=Strongylus vulgaris TaxID=40348 RepID=A0A3P7KG07_STRVU|nr:unnamed protein product [Strongylus vulgaris]